MTPLRTKAANATVTEALSYVRSEAAACVMNLRKVERFIVLHVPKVEDGNNFGVAIQMEVMKMVTEQGKTCKGLMDKLPDYHKERSAAMKEVAPKTSTDVTEAKTSSDDDETKGGEATKTSKSGTSKNSTTKTTSSPALPDALAHVVAIDVHWYFSLLFLLEVVRDSYIAVGDCLEKNKLKLTQPKGEGGNAMSMF